MYTAPVAVVITIHTGNEDGAPGEAPRIPTLYISLLCELVISALGLLLGCIRDEVFGIEHSTNEYRTFQIYEPAVLYDVAFLLSISLSMWFEP
jgi:hypothetical protein